jgi:hypothetical protein
MVGPEILRCQADWGRYPVLALDVAPNVQLTTRFRVADIIGCYAHLDRSSRLVGSDERVAFARGLSALYPGRRSRDR